MIVPNICDCISMVAPSYRHLRNRTPHPNPSRSCIALARRSYARASSRTHSPPWPKTGIPDHGPQASHAPGPEDPPAKGPRQPKPLSSHMLRPSHHPLRGGQVAGLTWANRREAHPLVLAGPATKASISAPMPRNFDYRFWLIYRYKILPVILWCKMTGKILCL